MTRTVYYKNNPHKIEFIKIDGRIRVRREHALGYITIPTVCLHNKEKLKPYIIMAIEGKDDYCAIQQINELTNL